MKKYTIIGGVMTLAIVFTLTLAASTYANHFGQGNGNGPNNGQRPEITEEMKEVHDKIKEAVLHEDYETFLDLIAQFPNGEERVADMTEEKFAEMLEKHQNQENIKELHEKIKEAVANGDYETWKALHEELPNDSEMLSVIDTEEKFNQLVSAHQLMEEGRAKMEEAKAIMEELGMSQPQKGPGFRGMQKGPKNFGQWRSQQNKTEE